MRRGVVRRQYLDAGDRPRLPDPAVAKRAQPCGAGGTVDPMLKGECGGDGEPGRIIERAGVDPGHDGVGAARVFGGIPVDAGQRAFADMEDADAQRRAEPFVAVQSDEIAIEVGQREVELLPTVRGIDDDVDTAGTGHRSDLANRDHQAGPVAQVGEEDELQPRFVSHHLCIGVDQAGARGGFG